MSSISPQEAYQRLQGGDAVLVDVREPDEFRLEHIPYALSIPLGGLAEGLAHLRLPAERAVIFHCLKGMRGQKACDAACGLGCVAGDPLNIEGGIAAWKEAGLPLIGTAPKLSLFRQVQIIVGFFLVALIGAGLLGFVAAFYIALLLSTAFLIAGVTGACGLAYILGKMPWNR